ncbi:protein of unknown function [Xenorhabdus poinarii G6]|uniref:Uncharacterized protein n=1 Tax=Xenorhabdus poinarii G6 TaxID=1354304 RepID=A0A068R0X2_9GAMM|nr:protein of unknown function [Xenorhabdus poinarii G6]
MVSNSEKTIVQEELTQAQLKNECFSLTTKGKIGR